MEIRECNCSLPFHSDSESIVCSTLLVFSCGAPHSPAAESNAIKHGRATAWKPANEQDFAYEADQKYKEGRYILEREMITERPDAKRDNAAIKVREVPLAETH